MTPLGASLGRSLLTLALVAMVVLGVYQGLWQWWGDPQAPSVWQGLWSADGALAAALCLLSYGLRGQRWRLWVAFIGADAIAGDVRLRDIDRFIVRMREVPTSNGKPRAINQIRQVLNVVRTVYNWGQSRELLTRNDFALFRWKRPKDAKVLEPEEYTPEEYTRLLAAASPQNPRTWRLHVALVLAGVHGSRARSVLHLRWADVVGDVITWPGEFMKQGEDHQQPLTWDALAALETARYWTREREGAEEDTPPCRRRRDKTHRCSHRKRCAAN